MTQLRHCFSIGIVAARKTLTGNPWAAHAWQPHAVLPASPAVAPGTAIGGHGPVAYVYAGPGELTLHRGATGHYRDNLTAAQPSIWVSLRADAGDVCHVAAVTADPYEGEAMTMGLDAIVEALPMPEHIQASVWAFVEAFHVEQPFIKRQRDDAAPARAGMRGHGR